MHVLYVHTLVSPSCGKLSINLHRWRSTGKLARRYTRNSSIARTVPVPPVILSYNILYLRDDVHVLLEVELESACLSGRVRRPLYSFDSTQPLGCLGGSVVRASVLASSVSWVRIPPEQLFFLFGEKRVVWVSCLPLFSIYRKEFSCTMYCSSRYLYLQSQMG